VNFAGNVHVGRNQGAFELGWVTLTDGRVGDMDHGGLYLGRADGVLVHT
jgi:hypothetical protein